MCDISQTFKYESAYYSLRISALIASGSR